MPCSHRLAIALMAALAAISQPGQAQAQALDRAVQVRPGARPPAAAMVRVALVIGNGAYADAPLRNPVNDARAMKEALEACRFQVTLVTDASRRAMEDAIRAFGDQIRGGAVGLFYFAGHGLQVEGANFLIPIGARLDKESDVPYEGVDVGRVLDSMKAAGNTLNILILDACRNNPFALAKGWRSLGGQGLAQVKAPTGSLIAYATAPGSAAADGRGEHGIYTEALLQEMREPGLKLEEVFKKVRERVLDGSRMAQTPWESNSTVGDFYFRPQRTADEIAAEQAALQADTRRLEAELQARIGQKGAEALRTRLRAEELERDRLAQEAGRNQQMEAEARRAEAEEAQRRESTARLEALKQRLAREQGPARSAADSLETARRELAGLARQREDLLRPLAAEQEQAVSRLHRSYLGLTARLGAPRDEFETADAYRARTAELAALRAKIRQEETDLDHQFEDLKRVQAGTLDERIRELETRKFTASFPVELGAYDPDRGRFDVRIAAAGPLQAALAMEPARARELKGRRDLLKAEGEVSLAEPRGSGFRLVDPLWGLLQLEAVRAAAEARAPAPAPAEFDDLVKAARAEGQLTVIACPRDWVNYGEIFHTFSAKYGIRLNELNPEGSSGEELAALRAGRSGQTPDVVDVGLSFGPQMVAEHLITPYKVKTWNTIPAHLKDPDGYWYGDYYGTLAFEVNTDLVKHPPRDWKDLLEPQYRGQVALAGDPRTSMQAFLAVASASLAYSGSFNNLMPGLQFFRKLNDVGNFVPTIAGPATVASGKTPITVRWDYNALANRDRIAGPRLGVFIPATGAVAAVYIMALNVHAPHPNAARLYLEFLYSDEGQLLWLKGYGHPVRYDDLVRRRAVPASLAARLPPPSAYAHLRFPSLAEQQAAKDGASKNWDKVVQVNVTKN